MKKIELFRPDTVEEAIETLSAKGREASVYAGGTDLLDRLKSRLITAPKYLVDLKQIKSLRTIRRTDDGTVVVGAMTTLTELLESSVVRNSLPIIGEAVELISSPELRNQSTVGGNILQEVWCPYLRNNYACWRNGGRVCYAEVGDNTVYQSVMGASRSYAVYHGDLAIALTALDASVKVATTSGVKELTMEELLPGELQVDERVQSHAIRQNEILTEIMIPPLLEKSRSAFEKVRYRSVWDFALASLAVVFKLGDTRIISNPRVVFGGIATRPWRDRQVEEFLQGKTLTQDLASEATTHALKGSKPLKHNAYKIDMSIGLLYSALSKR